MTWEQEHEGSTPTWGDHIKTGETYVKKAANGIVGRNVLFSPSSPRIFCAKGVCVSTFAGFLVWYLSTKLASEAT